MNERFTDPGAPRAAGQTSCVGGAAGCSLSKAAGQSPAGVAGERAFCILPCMSEQTSTGRFPYGAVGVVVVLLLVGVAYAVARAGIDLRLQAAAVGGLLILLAIVAYAGVRAGRSPVFVVIALLLPYALAASWGFGSAQRISSALEGYFSPDSVGVDEPLDAWPEDPPPEEDFDPLVPNLDSTGADDNGDGIPDDAYEGLECVAETSGEVQTCVMNGGL